MAGILELEVMEMPKARQPRWGIWVRNAEGRYPVGAALDTRGSREEAERHAAYLRAAPEARELLAGGVEVREVSDVDRFTWRVGDTAEVVEHDDQTRQPRPGGMRMQCTVTAVSRCYVLVEFPGYGNIALGQKTDQFWRDSGWRAWDGEFRWRLALKEVAR